MKTFVLHLFLLLSLGTACLAQSSLRNGLIAWYPMDGDANDYSGNDNHALPIGATLTEDRNGVPDAAYFFGGNNDYLSVSNQKDLNPDLPITLAAWIRMDDLNNNNVFQSDHHGSNYYGYWLTVVEQGRVSISLGDDGPIGPPSRRTKLGASRLETGTWYHVAGIIYSPSNMRIFINGKEDCGNYQGSGDPMPQHNVGDATIGRSTGDQFFHGAIDEVRFYNRALTKKEVRILADFPPQDAELCQNSSVQLDAGYGELIAWNPSKYLDCEDCKTPWSTPNQSVSYLALTENTPGCLDSVRINLTVDQCQVLPKLTITFSGSLDDLGVSLSWAVPQSNDIASFVIERSLDGSLYTPIGTSNQIVGDKFWFQDRTPGLRYAPPLHYRLKQVHFDGSMSLSSPIVIHTETSPAAQLVVFPNPVALQLQASLPSLVESGEATIISMSGQIVARQVIIGQQNLEMDVSSLPSGVYFLRIQASEQTFTQKFQVLR